MNTYLILIILTLLGAIYSALETSLFSMEQKKNQEALKSAKTRWYNDSFLLLNSFLIGNITANTIFSQISDVLIDEFLFSLSLSSFTISIISVIISTVISVVLIESIPKNFGIAFPQFTARFFKPVTKISVFVFSVAAYPMTKFFNFLFNKVSTQKEGDKMTEKEIRSIINLSYERDIVNPREKKLIDAITNLYSQQIYFFMTPRKEIITVDISDSIEDIWKLMKQNQKRTVLVIDESIDHVVGYLQLSDLSFIIERHAKDLLNQHKTMIKAIKLISESKRLIDAIHLLEKEKRALALVIDEYGGTQGVISLKDLTDSLLSFTTHVQVQAVGSYNQSILEEGEGYLVVNPLRMNIRFLQEYFKIEEIYENSSHLDFEGSMTRFLIKLLDRFPVEGESIPFQDFVFYIDKVDKNFISRVKVFKKEQENA